MTVKRRNVDLTNRCMQPEFKELPDEVVWELLMEVCLLGCVIPKPDVLSDIIGEAMGMRQGLPKCAHQCMALCLKNFTVSSLTSPSKTAIQSKKRIKFTKTY